LIESRAFGCDEAECLGEVRIPEDLTDRRSGSVWQVDATALGIGGDGWDCLGPERVDEFGDGIPVIGIVDCGLEDFFPG